MSKLIWQCTIGIDADGRMPDGADASMRRAIEDAYYRMTGRTPDFLFSGWNAELSESQRSALEPMPVGPPVRAN